MGIVVPKCLFAAVQSPEGSTTSEYSPVIVNPSAGSGKSGSRFYNVFAAASGIQISLNYPFIGKYEKDGYETNKWAVCTERCLNTIDDPFVVEGGAFSSTLPDTAAVGLSD